MSAFNRPRDVGTATPDQIAEWAYMLGFEDARHGRISECYRTLDGALGRGGPWVEHVAALVRGGGPFVARLRARYTQGAEDAARDMARSGRPACTCAQWSSWPGSWPCQPARWRGTIHA